MKASQSFICIFQTLITFLFVSSCSPPPAEKPWELRCDDYYKKNIFLHFPFHSIGYGQARDRDEAFDKASKGAKRSLLLEVRNGVAEWASVLLAETNSCNNIDIVKRFEVITLRIAQTASDNRAALETKFSYQDFTASGGLFTVYETAEAWEDPKIVAAMFVQEINGDPVLQTIYQTSNAFQKLIDLNSGAN